MSFSPPCLSLPSRASIGAYRVLSHFRMTLVRYYEIAQVLTSRGWEVHCWRVEDFGSSKWMAAAQQLDAPACVGAGEKLGEALTELFHQCCKAEARLDRFFPTPPRYQTGTKFLSDRPWNRPSRVPKVVEDGEAIRIHSPLARLRDFAISAVTATLAAIGLRADARANSPKAACGTSSADDLRSERIRNLIEGRFGFGLAAPRG